MLVDGDFEAPEAVTADVAIIGSVPVSPFREQIGGWMQIHFFGRTGDQIARSVNLDLPSTVVTVADLRRLLAQSYPDAAGELVRPSLRACVGDEIVGENHELRDSDFVEFLPPLSGG